MSAKIKICGLFRQEDIESVNLAKPDFIGFVFYEKSHRYVTPKFAVELKQKLSKDIKTVGVFVNMPIDEVINIANSVSLDIIQLHGDEGNCYISELRLKCKNVSEIWKAIRVMDDFDKCQMEKVDDADRFVFDAYVEGFGGQGKSFNTDLIKGVPCDIIILAGGLCLENIGTLIDKISPYAVDLSSGVETNKQKDQAKIIDIVKKVKNR